MIKTNFLLEIVLTNTQKEKKRILVKRIHSSFRTKSKVLLNLTVVIRRTNFGFVRLKQSKLFLNFNDIK